MICWLQDVQLGLELCLQGVVVEVGVEVQQQVVELRLRGWVLRVQVERLRGEWVAGFCAALQGKG